MSAKQHILIVEDEPAIATGLTDVFIYHGYDVTVCDDGESGAEQALTGAYDLLLLDVMLPKKNGFTICEEVRAVAPDQPIIMLTAKISDEDIVQGLRLGADDYVAKPFSVEQLVLRVAAVLRRASKPAVMERQTPFTVGPWEVHPERLQATQAHTQMAFTRREMQVLVYLHQNHTRPVPREEILANVWGYADQDIIETRTIDIHIAKLRKKIEADPKNPRHVVTVRGAGYQLLADR